MPDTVEHTQGYTLTPLFAHWELRDTTPMVQEMHKAYVAAEDQQLAYVIKNTRNDAAVVLFIKDPTIIIKAKLEALDLDKEVWDSCLASLISDRKKGGKFRDSLIQIKGQVGPTKHIPDYLMARDILRRMTGFTGLFGGQKARGQIQNLDATQVQAQEAEPPSATMSKACAEVQKALLLKDSITIHAAILSGVDNGDCLHNLINQIENPRELHLLLQIVNRTQYNNLNTARYFPGTLIRRWMPCFPPKTKQLLLTLIQNRKADLGSQDRLAMLSPAQQAMEKDAWTQKTKTARSAQEPGPSSLLGIELDCERANDRSTTRAGI